MKHIKVCLLLIFSSMIFACDYGNKYPGTDFLDLGSLFDGDTIVKNIPCTNIRSIFIVDSLMVLHCDNTLDGKLMQVYHLNSGTKLTSFAQYGRGPGEVDYADACFNPQKRIFQFITDHGQNIKFHIDSVILGKAKGISTKLKSQLRGSQYSFIDTLLFSSSAKFLDDFYRFAIMYPNGDTIFCYRDGTQKRTPVILKPDYTKCFTFYNGNLETEVFTLTKCSIKQYSHCQYINPDRVLGEDIIVSKDYPGIANYPFPTDKYIYAPWTSSLSPQKAIRADRIVIFNWDGSAKGYFTLENINNLYGVMNIDESSCKFYTVIKNKNGELNIVRYDMSHLPL